MNVSVFGNILYFSVNPNDEVGTPIFFHLPDGYSYKKLTILQSNKAYLYIDAGNPGIPLVGTALSFPVVNGKSPCTFSIVFQSQESSYITILIEELGAIPNPEYFSGSFKPILVTSKDGREYNMIPSNQFK